MQENQEIVPVKGYETFYGVTRDGRVFSFNYRRSGKIKELSLCNHGGHHKNQYKTVHFTVHFKECKKFVHRIVAETFIDNFNNYKCVNHINGIKSDNNVSNLEWVSHSINNSHAYKTGLKSNSGEKQSHHKLTDKQIIEIRRIFEKETYYGQIKEIAKNYGVTASAIRHIKERITWSHI